MLHLGARGAELPVHDGVGVVAPEVACRREANAHDVGRGRRDRDDALSAAVDEAVLDPARRRHVAQRRPLRGGGRRPDEQQERQEQADRHQRTVSCRNETASGQICAASVALKVPSALCGPMKAWPVPGWTFIVTFFPMPRSLASSACAAAGGK